MELPDISQITGLTVQQQLIATWITIGLKYLGEFYSTVRAGGGLKRIFMSFIYGEQLPKVIAEDYKQELSTPPFKAGDSSKSNDKPTS